MMREKAVRMTVCQHSSAMLIIRLHMISSPTGSASIRATASIERGVGPHEDPGRLDVGERKAKIQPPRPR